MGTYNKSVLTEAGQALIAKTVAGEVADINITRVVTDDSDYSTVEDVTALEQPLHERHSFLISSKHVVNQKTVFLRTVITNKDIYDAGYRIGALCVLAEDPDKGEILYAIATAEEGKGDHFDAYNGYLPSTITVDFYVEISNAEQVIINGGASGTASSADLDDLRREMEEALAGVSGAIEGSGEPSGDIEAAVGQHYVDTVAEIAYICVAVQEDGKRVWQPINGGGASKEEISKAIGAHNTDPEAHAAVIVSAVSKEIDKMAEGGSIVTSETMKQAVEEQVDKALAALPAGSYYGYLDLIIPATGWTEAEEPSADHNYICDVAAASVTGELIPIGGPKLGSCDVANKAGVAPGCETLEGTVRFFAHEKPGDDISAYIILLTQGQEGGGNASVEAGQGLAYGDDGKLTVKIGDGLAFDATDALSVDKEDVLTEDDMADDNEVMQSMQEIINT